MGQQRPAEAALPICPGSVCLRSSWPTRALPSGCRRPSTVACARLGARTWLGLNIIAWGLVSMEELSAAARFFGWEAGLTCPRLFGEQ